MGTYTHVRGWIHVGDDYNSISDFEKEFETLMIKAKELSPRAHQCVSSTTCNFGFDFNPYIFIGGAIKNYDDDWKIFINFIRKNFIVLDMHLEIKHEDWADWDVILERDLGDSS